MRYITAYILLFVWLIGCVSGCAFAPRFASQSAGVGVSPQFIERTKPVSKELSPKEIADQVERVIRDAVYVEDVMHVTQIDWPWPGWVCPDPRLHESYMVASWMASGEVVSTLFDPQNRSLMTYVVHAGQCQEYRIFDVPTPLLEYVSQFPQGSDGHVMQAPEECFLGAHVYSWVGSRLKKGPDRVVSIRRKIERGERQADEVERGRLCYVFLQEIPPDEPQIIERVFIDKETFVTMRWDTRQGNTLRIRQMNSVFWSYVPEHIQWRLLPKPANK